MKKGIWLVPAIALALCFGMADQAFGALGACATCDGSNGQCVLNQSQETCESPLGLNGVWQGAGSNDCRDCDCDGMLDVQEICNCVAACCIATKGAADCDDDANALALCETACDKDGDTRPNDCDPDAVIIVGGWCCNPDTGYLDDPDDGVACTVDTCLAGGVPLNTPNHAYCETTYGSGECDYVLCEPPSPWGGCVRHNNTAGTACGSAANTDCDNPDTCNGSGVCVANNEANGTTCTDEPNECTQDVCSAGVCTHQGAPYNLNPCTDDGLECTADYCWGGACAHPGWPKDGQACTDDGNQCKGDVCAGGVCTHPNLAWGTLCGNAALGVCDVQDICGGDGLCYDLQVAAGTTCRAVAGQCDLPEVCDGLSDNCPPDAFYAATVPCRYAAGICDVEEKCPGNGVNCPADAFLPTTTVCRPTAGVCDVADYCPGNAAGCTADAKQPTTFVCRASAGECDAVEKCDGVTNPCPADNVAAMNMLPCTADPNQCTSDVCWNNACVHPAKADWTVCNDAEVCTLADYCYGGVCTGFNWDACDDGVACTADACIAGQGCENDYCGGVCNDLLVKLVPTAEDVYQKGCFTVEVYVMDASDAGDGINCAFVDLALGQFLCPLSVMDLGDPIYAGSDYQVEVNSALFPDFNSWWVEPPYDVLDFGGCTNVGGVGACEWVLLGTVEVIAPNKVCNATLSADQSGFTQSSLIGQGYAVATEEETVSPVSMHCWGELYDNTNAWFFVDAGDLSFFATCWMMPAAPGCEDYDYDLDGVVGPGDLAFFATAWQEFVCAGGVIIPVDQMGCGDPYPWGPGGAAGLGTNGVKIDEDGNVTSVQVPWASPELIQSFGLPVPPRDWAGWRLDGGRDDVLRAGTKERAARER